MWYLLYSAIIAIVAANTIALLLHRNVPVLGRKAKKLLRIDDSAISSVDMIVDGYETRFRVVQKGTLTNETNVILMIHGISCSSSAWLPTMIEFNKHRYDDSYLMLAPDMPGYGHTQGGSLNIDELAVWCSKFVDVAVNQISQMRLTGRQMKFHAVGNSMGCQVAITLAKKFPDRVKSITLLGPTPGGQYRNLLSYGCGLILDCFCEKFSYNATLWWMFLEQGIFNYIRTVFKAFAIDPTIDNLKHLHCPMKIIRGRQDLIITNSTVRALLASYAQSPYVLSHAHYSPSITKAKASSSSSESGISDKLSHVEQTKKIYQFVIANGAVSFTPGLPRGSTNSGAQSKR